jgi:hypothetical protein
MPSLMAPRSKFAPVSVLQALLAPRNAAGKAESGYCV